MINIKVQIYEIDGIIQIPIPDAVLETLKLNIGDKITFDKTKFGYIIRKYDELSDHEHTNTSIIEINDL